MSEEVDCKQGELLFHHHESVYQDPRGGLWLSSSLGIWLDEVASRVDRLYILKFQTIHKSKKHDYQLRQGNIQWINLGANRGYLDFVKKRKRVDSECRQWSGKVDYLLIRGFTPFQNRVWQAISVRKSKAYLLVRSFRQPRPLSLYKPLFWLAYVKNKLQEYRFDAILESADYLFTNSKEVQNELEQKCGKIASYSTTNVLKASDFTSFGSRSWDRNFRMLFVGRVSELKGIRELIDAFVRLQKLNPEMKVFLDIVGEGLQDFVDEVKGGIRREGLVDQVCFHGRVSFGEKLFELYRNANVFVLPSYSEGFPRVVWEAALFCVPIVVTRVGGIPDVLEDRKHALLVKARDSRALLVALEEQISDEEGGVCRARCAYDLAIENTLESGVDVLTHTMIK